MNYKDKGEHPQVLLAIPPPPKIGGEFEMYELVYGSGFEGDILERYPKAKIEDASDFIHTHRFEVRIEGTSEMEFYKFAIEKGFVDLCLGFQVMAMGNKDPNMMKELLEYAKSLHPKNQEKRPTSQGISPTS